MTSDHVTPEHTSLPMHLVHGYIGAYVDTLGLCGAQSAFMIGAERHSPDKAQVRELRKLFWEVFLARRAGEPLPPLSREQLLVLYDGLFQSYAPRGVKGMTQAIGRFWCFDTKKNGYILNHRDIISTIVPKLQPLIASPTITSLHQHRQLALLKTLLLGFRKESNQPMQIVSEPDSITWQIEHCPICNNHELPCKTFWGIAEGFLSWITQHHPDSGGQEPIALDTARSTEHRIVVAVSRGA
jgi:hypothetical protein